MELLNSILEKTYSSQDLKHRMIILRYYLEFKLFGNAVGTKTFSHEDLQWLSSLNPEYLSKFTKHNLYEHFHQLEAEVNKLQTIVMYLSFEPNQTQMEQIHFWMMNNLSQKLMIDVKIDAALLGGCALVYKGIYKDYSLRSKILAQGETILTEFKRFIK